MLANAAWKRGSPGAGTANVSYSSRASSSDTALAKAYRNWSYVRGTARPRLSGLARTGDPARSAEIGSGRTPRNGAGSIATETADSPRPARICVSNPPKEWPTIAGFASSRRMTASKWSAISLIDLLAKTLGSAFASATVSGSSGQPGASVAYPASSKRARQRSQLLGSSHRPWTNTTGTRPDSLASSICCVSCRVMSSIAPLLLDARSATT